jgi:hypothetical protein
MPVDRIPRNAYSDENARVRRTVTAQLEIVIQNIVYIRRADPSGETESAARSFLSMLKKGQTLTPGQLSYADGIYEKMMKSAGFGSVNVHSDRRKRSLKYG